MDFLFFTYIEYISLLSSNIFGFSIQTPSYLNLVLSTLESINCVTVSFCNLGNISTVTLAALANF